MKIETPNHIKTSVDIRNNPEHWNQKISIIEFKDKKGKPYWTKEFPFLPHWRRWKEATEWIKNTDFPEYNCKVVWNENVSISLYTQNYFGESIALEQKEKDLLGKIRIKIHREINNPNINFDLGMNQDIEQEIAKYQTELREALKLDTYKQLHNFPYSHLFSEELKELKRTSIKKEKASPEKRVHDLGRSDLAILWKKKLYWITNTTYSNNYKLYLEITGPSLSYFFKISSVITNSRQRKNWTRSVSERH
ncbi:MAG: hypothetical protein GBAus27B_000441 [Mycoplasmataceae bacterium]|nr:MAG: hypothetical protein GBAus27B_000441 [Mycoplasmataceae bacterium]